MKTECIIRIFLHLSIGCFFSLSAAHPGAQPQSGARTSDETLPSLILKEDRILRISLPDAYEQGRDEYPVLYQLDGTARFFPIVAQAVRDLFASGRIPDMIVVGIENTDRWRDMLPLRVEAHPTSGEANRFLRFIEEELIPFVQGRYRAGGVRILFGCSNSALFALYAMTERPHLFGGTIAGSPSLGHAEGFLFDRINAFGEGRARPGFLFISNGGEDTALRLVQPIPRFIDALRERPLPDLLLRYEFYADEGHCPRPTLTDGLVAFFAEGP